MQTHWTPTDTYYHRLLEAADEAARRQLYLELFVEPWKPMMDIMTSHFGGGASDDPLAGARAWAWLLPDQTDAIADLLAKMEAADAWAQGKAALEEAAARFDPYADRLQFEDITGWLVLADPARSNQLEQGYTGAIDWMQPRFIGQFWQPDERNLPRLSGLVAHEMHHLIRLRAFPWGANTSVADYIVVEGTAEAFAASLYGEDKVGYFITEFDPQDFETARTLIGQGLRETGFDVIRGYIFGEALAEQFGFKAIPGMPTYGGYNIGYHVVRAFLERSGMTIEEATFVPADQIVSESGFFE